MTSRDEFFRRHQKTIDQSFSNAFILVLVLYGYGFNGLVNVLEFVNSFFNNRYQILVVIDACNFYLILPFALFLSHSLINGRSQWPSDVALFNSKNGLSFTLFKNFIISVFSNKLVTLISYFLTHLVGN